MKKIFIRIVVVITAILVLLTGIYFIFPGAILMAGYQVARWRAGVECKKVTVGDHAWTYLEGGRGYPVLMLHGFGMFKDYWGDVTVSLTKHYRVIIPDLPGFGENSRIMSDTYNISNQARRVKEFADKIGLKNFYLIGFSMGGGIAAYYAAEYPDSVKGLVLIDAMGMDTPVESELEVRIAKGEDPMIYKNIEQFDKLQSLAYFTPPDIPVNIKKFIATVGAEYYSFHDKIFNDLKKDGMSVLENKLPKIKSRTLVLWGDKDRIFDVSTAYAFGKGIRNSKVVIIPGTGHMVFFEKPDESIKAVTDFLAAK